MSTCLSCGNDRPCCCGPPVEADDITVNEDGSVTVTGPNKHWELSKEFIDSVSRLEKRPAFIPSAYQQPEEERLLHPSTKWALRFLECHAMPTDTEVMRHYLVQAFNAGAKEAIGDVMEVCDLWID